MKSRRGPAERSTRIQSRNHPGGSILAAIMAQFLTAINTPLPIDKPIGHEEHPFLALRRLHPFQQRLPTHASCICDPICCCGTRVINFKTWRDKVIAIRVCFAVGGNATVAIAVRLNETVIYAPRVSPTVINGV